MRGPYAIVYECKSLQKEEKMWGANMSSHVMSWSSGGRRHHVWSSSVQTHFSLLLPFAIQLTTHLYDVIKKYFSTWRCDRLNFQWIYSIVKILNRSSSSALPKVFECVSSFTRNFSARTACNVGIYRVATAFSNFSVHSVFLSLPCALNKTCNNETHLFSSCRAFEGR